MKYKIEKYKKKTNLNIKHKKVNITAVHRKYSRDIIELIDHAVVYFHNSPTKDDCCRDFCTL